MGYRIGIVGYGRLGRYLYQQLTKRHRSLVDVAFVFSRDPSSLIDVPSALQLSDLKEFAQYEPDLVVEVADPAVTRAYGPTFLATSDYMPLSLSCFAEPDVEAAAIDAARLSGRRLLIPRGSAVGLTALEANQAGWQSIVVTTQKDPSNLDFLNDPRWKSRAIATAETLFEGSTREVCSLYPRNVNSHAAIALAGIGFDRTVSILRAVPGTAESTLSLSAIGDGMELRIERVSPISGVTGDSTLTSVVGSVMSRASAPGIQFC